MRKQLPIMLAAIAALATGGVATLGTLSAAPAQNAEQQAAVGQQTATFAVENMTCALCPVTVRKAMARVPGVKAVTVDLEAKTATVTFDPLATTTAAIAAASTNAGYPAKRAGQGGQ